MAAGKPPRHSLREAVAQATVPRRRPCCCFGSDGAGRLRRIESVKTNNKHTNILVECAKQLQLCQQSWELHVRMDSLDPKVNAARTMRACNVVYTNHAKLGLKGLEPAMPRASRRARQRSVGRRPNGQESRINGNRSHMQHTQTEATNSGLEATMANTIESRDVLSLGPLYPSPTAQRQ